MVDGSTGGGRTVPEDSVQEIPGHIDMDELVPGDTVEIEGDEYRAERDGFGEPLILVHERVWKDE